ncbi:ABC-type transport system, permease and ATPase component [Methyloglobulus morosus KoM1]|uniref:ABC-type transport system, permease and ATPase component n=1 Tax=Methyloglobulus morosus KoM1 TaxID=1116472 RepID=V5DRD2_9GAMM|nr:SbmA/BacA-like family transporter [Methyloglobulus morosus]ESS69991.1 ABC-type transport system, permease and ATPase component [Methyloglobulus morosus KoM1]
MQNKDSFFIQFMKLAGPYWNSENKLAIRTETVLLVVLTLMQIGLAVYVTKWNATLFDAIEQRSMDGVKAQIGVLILIFAASITVTTAHLIVKRRLLIGWRTWLTEKVISKWMHNGRHYQITLRSKNDHDNPDGRIAEDIRIATEDAINLSHSLFYSLLMLGSFTKILWDISGRVVFDFNFVSIPVTGYLVWISVSYSICASILGWWMGKSMTEATHARQTQEANFRHDLIDTQGNSQAIALIRGEDMEQERLLASFQAIIATYAQQTSAWKQIQIFTSGYSVTSMALPILVGSPRYIVGAISLGMLMQSVQAFQHMVSALSWPVDNMALIAQWRTSVERVLGLVNGLDHLEDDIYRLDSSQLSVKKASVSGLKLNNVRIASVEGENLSIIINDEIKAGERVLVSDQTNAGSKLFKAIAGLWPWGAGAIEIPENDTLFVMPSKPYLPSKSLFEAICYPKPSTSFDQAQIEKLLIDVGQHELVKQLDRIGSWEQLLSNEQQQYLGVVRVLLHRPQWLFIQEALDSLTPNDEVLMLELLGNELPRTGILTITHQPAAEAFHQRTLKI